MQEKTKSLFKYLINLSFILYFLILIAERTISVVKTITSSTNGWSVMYSTPFNGFVYTTVFASIIAFLVYFIIYDRDSIKLLFMPNKKDILNVDFKKLSIASGILLISGMVYTLNTIPVIQFISYGVLIAGLLLKTIEHAYESKDICLTWGSFIYLVCFSMAIPVMHNQNGLVPDKTITAYTIISALAVFILVGSFTYLEVKLFSDKYNDLFDICPFALVIIFDVVLSVWPQMDKQALNVFALIFLGATVLFFILGVIRREIQKKKQIPQE